MFVEKKHLDKFFTEQYNYLQAFTNVVSNGYTVDTSDVLHDAYQKVARRISNAHLIANLTGYTMIVIRNTLYSRAKKKINKPHLDVSCYSNQEEVEVMLSEIEENDFDKLNYYNEIEWISREIFNYLKINYTEREQYIFRCYYLNEKMTYNKLSTMSGFSVGYCAELIKLIKKDLKENLIKYINGQTDN